MAIKSDNVQGNQYHDESTGEFTSPNNASAKGGKFSSIRLKANFNVNSARADLQKVQPQIKAPQIGVYQEAQTIEEAVAIGRNILPNCMVNYSSKCDVTKVNELNKALSDIANRFPGFVQNGLLNAYGDGLSLNVQELKDNAIKTALNVIQTDAYFRKTYDEFFEYSKTRYGLSDEDKYNEKVFSHFMGFDSAFNPGEYVKNFHGGGALAYYQVSQRNIFHPGAGGAGINGVVKIYASTLQKPTQYEIEENANAVKQGFHFDYGNHSYTYATGVHELGHSIFTIAYKKCTDEERNEIDNLIKDGFGKDRNQVSGYGHTNAYEQEAEAVADVMCRGNNATLHNQKMVAWLDAVHTRLKNGGEI